VGADRSRRHYVGSSAGRNAILASAKVKPSAGLAARRSAAVLPASPAANSLAAGGGLRRAAAT